MFEGIQQRFAELDEIADKLRVEMAKLLDVPLMPYTLFVSRKGLNIQVEVCINGAQTEETTWIDPRPDDDEKIANAARELVEDFLSIPQWKFVEAFDKDTTEAGLYWITPGGVSKE